MRNFCFWLCFSVFIARTFFSVELFRRLRTATSIFEKLLDQKTFIDLVPFFLLLKIKTRLSVVCFYGKPCCYARFCFCFFILFLLIYLIPQMSFAYSFTARSAEKIPAPAMLCSDICVHFFVSRYRSELLF